MTTVLPSTGSPRDQKKGRTWAAIHSAALRLVIERGSAGVTVDEICAEADVSPRTFCNYFPSKTRAAMGLSTRSVSAALRDTCTHRGGDLVSDLCDVVAHVVVLPEDWRTVHGLVRSRPEMSLAVIEWTLELRDVLLDVAEERVDSQTARTAVALVLGALGELTHRPLVDPPDAPGSRLRGVIEEMSDLARPGGQHLGSGVTAAAEARRH
jgi:AcrR family transcriptional regulator